MAKPLMSLSETQFLFKYALLGFILSKETKLVDSVLISYRDWTIFALVNKNPIGELQIFPKSCETSLN